MTSAATRYNQVRRAKVAAGTWLPPQPLGPVRAHLTKITRRQGMTIQEVADATGIPAETLYGIRSGQRHKEIHGANAAAILAVVAPKRPVNERPRRYRNLVNAAGTRRRVQAMCWMGHGIGAQAAAAPVAEASLKRIVAGVGDPARRDWCTRETEQRIAALYDRWSLTPGKGHAARAAATKKGWHGPGAWDDDTIGDPAAKPQLDGPVTRAADVSRANVEGALAGDFGRADLTTAETLEVVTRLVEVGRTDEQIGDHLKWGDSPTHRRDNACRFRRAHGIPDPPERLRAMAVAAGKQLSEYLKPAA